MQPHPNPLLWRGSKVAVISSVSEKSHSKLYMHKAAFYLRLQHSNEKYSLLVSLRLNTNKGEKPSPKGERVVISAFAEIFIK